MGKCNCFDVKMDLTTDMEKRYLTVNQNGLLQLVGNYEVNVQVPSENIIDDLRITDVYHSKNIVENSSCFMKGYAGVAESNPCVQPHELYLSFNNTKLLWSKRNECYVGLFKKSASSKRFALINDRLIHDERLKLYCWSYYDGEGYVYFYTYKDYTADDLVNIDPSIFVHRIYNVADGNGYSTEFDNYAISLNELYENLDLCVSDVSGGDSAEFFKRHEDKDLDGYYDGAISKNSVERYFENGMSKVEVLQIIMSKSIREGQGHFINNYYCGHFPIVPILLGDLLVRYEYYEDGMMASSWKKLNEFTEEEFKELRELVIKLPYDEGYVFSRYIKRGYNIWNQDTYTSCKQEEGSEDSIKLSRWGGGSRLDVKGGSHFASIPVQICVLNADEIKHRTKPSNSFLFKIKQYSNGNFVMKH